MQEVLTEISTFIHVVEGGSLTAAAKTLGVPKSTISRRLARLERVAGLRLLQRSARQVSPTEEGLLFYQRVAPALEAVGQAASALREHAGSPRGLLRITAPPDWGGVYLPRMLLAFQRQYPEVKLHVELAARRIDLLREGFDLAFRGTPVGDESLVARRLGTFAFWFFASPEYLKDRTPPRSPSDLQDHPLITFQHAGEESETTLQGPDGESVSIQLRGEISSNDHLFLRQAILEGAGIGMLPAYLCARDLEQGRLVRLLWGWSLSGTELYLVYPRMRYVPARVRAFRDFALQWIQDTGPSVGLCPQGAHAMGKHACEASGFFQRKK